MTVKLYSFTITIDGVKYAGRIPAESYIQAVMLAPGEVTGIVLEDTCAACANTEIITPQDWNEISQIIH